jgi:hypothetical protein
VFAVRRFQFPFQGFEKRFGARIVPAIPFLISCSGEQSGTVPQDGPEKIFAVLHSPVRVEEQALLSLPVCKCHVHRGYGRMNGLHIAA